MALTKEQKKKIVEELKQNVAEQKAMVFVAVDGLKAADLFDLRKKLKAADCLLVVAKKTLLNIAFKEKKVDIDLGKLTGQIALVFGFKDELSPAKIPYNFSLENQNLKILGGFYEDEAKGVEEIITLAKIPSKEELLARVVGSIKAPIANFVNVLQGNIKGLVYVLSQINK